MMMMMMMMMMMSSSSNNNSNCNTNIIISFFINCNYMYIYLNRYLFIMYNLRTSISHPSFCCSVSFRVDLYRSWGYLTHIRCDMKSSPLLIYTPPPHTHTLLLTTALPIPLKRPKWKSQLNGRYIITSQIEDLVNLFTSPYKEKTMAKYRVHKGSEKKYSPKVFQIQGSEWNSSLKKRIRSSRIAILLPNGGHIFCNSDFI